MASETMRGRLWVVYQCQKKPEIELQLNMHSWVCFIIYNTYFWMLYHSSDGSPILLIPFNQPPSFKILWTAAARQAGAHGARPSLSLQHLSQKSNTRLRNLEFQSWVNWKQKGKPSYFGVSVSKMEPVPPEEVQKIKKSRLSHQISLPQWQALC